MLPYLYENTAKINVRKNRRIRKNRRHVEADSCMAGDGGRKRCAKIKKMGKGKP